jgi:hypothetical protein
MKIKEVEAYSLALLHVFLTGMHAKKFATDARRYVGWGRGSLGFQHITLIQEIYPGHYMNMFKTPT